MGWNIRWRLVPLVPLVGLLYGPLMEAHRPQLFGLPFAFSFELGCAALAAVLSWAVYRPEP
jgi:Protein of unknown function (DUF3311)